MCSYKQLIEIKKYTRPMPMMIICVVFIDSVCTLSQSQDAFIKICSQVFYPKPTRYWALTKLLISPILVVTLTRHRVA